MISAEKANTYGQMAVTSRQFECMSFVRTRSRVKKISVVCFRFTDWGFGEPNSHADHEDCVELTASTGLWNDRVCSGTLSYMCEKAASE